MTQNIPIDGLPILSDKQRDSWMVSVGWFSPGRLPLSDHPGQNWREEKYWACFNLDHRKTDVLICFALTIQAKEVVMQKQTRTSADRQSIFLVVLRFSHWKSLTKSCNRNEFLSCPKPKAQSNLWWGGADCRGDEKSCSPMSVINYAVLALFSE